MYFSCQNEKTQALIYQCNNKTVMTRPAELASFNVAHSDDAIMHHPRDTLKDLTLAGHVITITYTMNATVGVPDLEGCIEKRPIVMVEVVVWSNINFVTPN